VYSGAMNNRPWIRSCVARETLDWNALVDDFDDFEYFRHKMCVALQIPREFMEPAAQVHFEVYCRMAERRAGERATKPVAV